MTGTTHDAVAASSRWTTDFGRTRRATPAIVVETRSEDDVVRALRLARSRGLTVTVRGAGHSVNGQTLTDGGMQLVNCAPEGSDVTIGSDGTAEMAARQTWRTVERAANRAGRTVPVLADYLDLSVGGTLSVGCYGIDSIAGGPQTDHVERLRLVRPDGSAGWCSPTEDADLFFMALAGLGQVGVIERVVIRTRPHRPLTTLFTYAHRDLATMAESLRWLLDVAPDEVPLWKALASRGRCVTVVGGTSDGVRPAFAMMPPAALRDVPVARRLVCPRYRFWRSRAVALWVAWFGGCRRLWADYVLDHAALAALAAHVQQLAEDPRFARCLASVYVLGIRSAADRPRAPFEAAGAIAGAVKFGMGLYCMVPEGDDAALAGVRAVLDGCLARCLDLGGRPYLYGAHRLEPAMMERAYASDLARLRELRRGLDPDGRFQPGVLP